MAILGTGAATLFKRIAEGQMAHTCTISRNGATVASAVPCLFREDVASIGKPILDGMLIETTPHVQFSCIFKADVDVREHDIISAVKYTTGNTDTRHFAVQLVKTSHRLQGVPLYTQTWAKVA